MDAADPIPLRWLTDDCIGERRQVLVGPDGRVIGMRMHRWSSHGRKARWGETYVARIISVDKPKRGAYLDLGLRDEGGFLRLNSSGAVRFGDNSIALKEGALVVVGVAREAARGKQPVVRLLSDAVASEHAKPSRFQTRDAPFNIGASPNFELRELIDSTLEEVASAHAQIPGGGKLSIEPTAALVAIDVDSEGRKGSGDAERFARELNVAAALEAVRQLRLRSLGGLIAIDFVSMRAEESRKAVQAALKIALKTLPWAVQIAPMSRFGVVECAIEQLLTPLHEIMLTPDRRMLVETEALAVLRAMEREAAAHGGRRLEARVRPEVERWLLSDQIAWREALVGRIGPRFEIVRDADLPPGRTDIRSI